ncbi:hypothetical protein TM7_0146 [candidate division TM7 genomosp. GTL1]|nr:hypothetical protein TM7_0146 [candidate division TM7 genomosp. GTL1]
MAIKATEFYKKFRLKALGVALLIQIAVGSLVAVWYINVTVLGVASDDFLLLLVAPFLLFEVIAIIVSNMIITEPTKLMADAVLHATAQAGNTAPPDVSHERFERSGLSTLVRDIYKLATPDKKPAGTELPKRDEVLQRILDMLPMGIILADSSGNILHANSKAPLHKDATTLKSLDLQFDHENTFEAWLTKNETEAITTEHTWSRVRNQSQSEKFRKFYDIIASYHKAGEDNIETVIVAIDRTAEYGPTEEAMDFIALAACRGCVVVLHHALVIPFLLAFCLGSLVYRCRGPRYSGHSAQTVHG